MVQIFRTRAYENEILENVDFEDEGKPFVVVEPAKKIGKDYCSFICYKKDSLVPDKFYERLGYKK